MGREGRSTGLGPVSSPHFAAVRVRSPGPRGTSRAGRRRRVPGRCRRDTTAASPTPGNPGRRAEAIERDLGGPRTRFFAAADEFMTRFRTDFDRDVPPTGGGSL